MQISSSQKLSIPTTLDIGSSASDATMPSFADAMSAQQALVNKLADNSDIPAGEKDEVREAFNDFVGQTLFGQLLKSMRSTVGKPAYFHGGRTEEIFQSQLDNVITDKLTESSAQSYADPMFELFQLNRK
jgi:hypothetical protein